MDLDKQHTFLPFIYKDEIFDLSHLNAHKVEYIQPAASKMEVTQTSTHPIIYTFYVTYSSHCFTKDYSGQTDEEKNSLMYHSEKESRPFCKVRYQLSLSYLPGIIRELNQHKIGGAGYDQYATIKIADNLYYKVVFVVYKFKKKLRLHVTSAYPIERWEKLKPVGFFKIAQNLMCGKKLPQP